MNAQAQPVRAFGRVQRTTHRMHFPLARVRHFLPIRWGKGRGEALFASSSQPGFMMNAEDQPQQLFFLHAPSFFNSSHVPVICSRCDLTSNPSRWLISFSIFSIFLLSNSTIF